EDVQTGLGTLHRGRQLPARTATGRGAIPSLAELAVGGSAPFGSAHRTGKSWLAQALANKACRDGHGVLYRPAGKLFRDLGQAQADGSLGRLLAALTKVDVLV